MSVFNAAVFNPLVYLTGGLPITNGGAKRAYQPTSYELRARRELEDKLNNAELDVKAAQIKIENLEFKRLRDLADEAMQLELLMLLKEEQRLQKILDSIIQKKLAVLRDDDDFAVLLMCLTT